MIKQIGNITIKTTTSKKKIKDILSRDLGAYDIEGKIESVRQTKGPTVFTISDGTGTLECTGFIAPGKRAYPDISDGDMVAATIQVSKNNDKTRREIESISKVSDSMKSALVERMAEALKNQASVDDIDFIVKSEKMEKLKEKMKSCASAIKRAIVEGSPIYLRHHADVDGYTGALALEQVILKLINQYHTGENDAVYKYYNRTPSKAPFYEYADVIRDVA
ncbi:MAG: phosphoesterase, partial [Candidatus Aenigmarchaeota archaeon]|nr:phosphoesterase [Candidatus Aenigmarchaeota archaeon]